MNLVEKQESKLFFLVECPTCPIQEECHSSF
jgi:hypothetical protein